MWPLLSNSVIFHVTIHHGVLTQKAVRLFWFLMTIAVTEFFKECCQIQRFLAQCKQLNIAYWFLKPTTINHPVLRQKSFKLLWFLMTIAVTEFFKRMWPFLSNSVISRTTIHHQVLTQKTLKFLSFLMSIVIEFLNSM